MYEKRRNMAGSPIPNDWSGADFNGICIFWPDSPQWIAILSGLITMVSLETFWDETTGNIDNVLEAAYEIQERNTAYDGCGEEQATVIYSTELKTDAYKGDNDFSPLLQLPFINDYASNNVLCHYQCQFYRAGQTGWVDFRIRLETGEILSTGSIYANVGHVVGISGSLTTDSAVQAGPNTAYLEWKTDGAAYCNAGASPGRYMASLIVQSVKIDTSLEPL